MEISVGVGIIIIGLIIGFTNIKFIGHVKYHGITLPPSIVLKIIGSKIAGWW